MKSPCPTCQKPVTITAEGKHRVHGPRNAPCPGSGQPLSVGDHSAASQGEAWCEEHGQPVATCRYCITDPEKHGEIDDDYSEALAALDRLNSDEVDADADYAALTGADEEERPGSDQESAALSDADNAEPEALLAQLNGAVENPKVVPFADWVPKDPAVRAVKEEQQARVEAARGDVTRMPAEQFDALQASDEPDDAPHLAKAIAQPRQFGDAEVTRMARELDEATSYLKQYNDEYFQVRDLITDAGFGGNTETTLERVKRVLERLRELMSEKGELAQQLETVRTELDQQYRDAKEYLVQRDEARQEAEQARTKYEELVAEYQTLEVQLTQSRNLWSDAEKVAARAVELGLVVESTGYAEPEVSDEWPSPLCKRCDYRTALHQEDLCSECKVAPPEPETAVITEAEKYSLAQGDWPEPEGPREPAPEPSDVAPADDGKVVCPVCSQRASVTAKNEYRVHGPKANRCPQGGQPITGTRSTSDPEIGGSITITDPSAITTGYLTDPEPPRAQTVVTDPKDEARARGERVPATPAFVGEQELPSLGATMALGHDPAIAMAIRLVQMQVPLACDIETEGLGNAARLIKSVTFCDSPEGRLVTILDPRDPDQAKVIKWVMDQAPELIFHNSPFDVPNLAINGLFTVEHTAKVIDTQLYARLAEPDNQVSKGLGACAERYLGIPLDSTGLIAAGKAVGMRNKEQIFREMDLDRPVYVRGAAADAVVTARLKRPLQRAALTRLTTGHPFADWGVQGSEALHLLQREQVLNRMSLRRSGVRGLVADLEFLDEFNARHAMQIDQQAHQLTDLGIRPGNAPDLLKFLEFEGVIPEDYPRTEKTKQLSGSKDHLALINHPIAQLFVDHKEKTHVLHDYLEKVRDHAVEMPDGTMRIFPVVNYFGATTGRMSIAGDPLQQFPEDARGVVRAEPGTRGLTSIDWSQIEPVTIANIAGQFDMLAGYESGEMDFYDALEKATGLPRKKNKTQLLGTLYGQGLALTAAKLGVDLDEARRIKDAVFAPMPKVLELTNTLREIGDTHQMVPTVSGRIIPVPSGWYTDKKTGERSWSVHTHKAVNYFVQGSAYDLLAESAYQCEVQGYGDAIMLLMHDEVVCDTEAAEDIRRIMETPPERLIRHTGRTPVLRTDMEHMGERWAKV